MAEKITVFQTLKRPSRKKASKPQFLRAHRFSEDLVLAEMLKLEVKLDKPIFIGQAVLDLSKLTMYQLRYEKLQI